MVELLIEWGARHRERVGFTRLTAGSSARTTRGTTTRLLRLRAAGLRDATVRVLHPFSWDAKERGIVVDELPVGVGRILLSGPYAAADAAALSVSADTDFDLRPDDGTDMTRYLAHGTVATIESTVQDSAGWCTVAGTDGEGEPVALAFALDSSDTTLIRLEPDGGDLLIETALPWQTFSPAAMLDLPGAHVRAGAGSHEEAEEWLRELIRDTLPKRPLQDRVAIPVAPPLIADTWGFGEDIDADRVTAFFDVAADLGVEVVTVDKGWEDRVGDWIPRAGYRDGIAGLAALAHDRGMALGMWVGAGNADPLSIVATEHPEWLTTWRGQHPLLSFRNHTLCLGHGPAREHVLTRLDALATDGMDWLLHDFETMPRCDSDAHDHDPGAGEHANVRGWYAILDELRTRHPALVVENCWNGGRPLDLAMIAHHDTTIGDDWCRAGTNRIAKLGLGRYLPSNWCTAYMSDEPELPLRAQVAPYVIGGPWVLMGDLPGWGPEHRATMERAIAVYQRWRTSEPGARVIEPRATGGLPGLATTRQAGAAQLAAFVVGEEHVGAAARWFPELTGDAVVTDEWSGAQRHLTADELAAGIPLDTREATGLLVSVRPAR